MKLTNQDLDILRELLEDKLKNIDHESEKQQVYINIIKKLDSMYFM